MRSVCARDIEVDRAPMKAISIQIRQTLIGVWLEAQLFAGPAAAEAGSAEPSPPRPARAPAPAPPWREKPPGGRLLRRAWSPISAADPSGGRWCCRFRRPADPPAHACPAR